MANQERTDDLQSSESMNKGNSDDELYFQTSYRSSDETENLNIIELSGIPGERQENGEYIVNEQVNGFFEERIAKELFRSSRKLSGYQVTNLKVWLYDTSLKLETLGNQFPKLTEKTLKIESFLDQSELDCIYVLNDWADECDAWEAACKKLLAPLFHQFVPPPDPPDVLKDFLVMRLGIDLTNKLDLYLSMRKNMFFNALIVQINMDTVASSG